MDLHAPHPPRLAYYSRLLLLFYSAVAMLGGIAFVYLSWKHQSSSLAMLAVVLVLTSPMLAVLALLPRMPFRDGAVEPSPSDVSTALHEIRRALTLVRASRAHIGVLSAGALVQWVSQLCGLADILGFLVFYSAACLLAAAAFLPWLSRCEHRLTDERTELERLREESPRDLRNQHLAEP